MDYIFICYIVQHVLTNLNMIFLNLIKKLIILIDYFFKRFCWITGEYGRCTITIEHRIGNFKYNHNIKFNPITIFIFPLIPVYNIIIIVTLMKILCSNMKAND